MKPKTTLKTAIADKVNELLLINRATGVSANEIADVVMEVLSSMSRPLTQPQTFAESISHDPFKPVST